MPSCSSCRTVGRATSLGDLVYEGLLGAPSLVEPRQRRVGAHATGVRPEVAVAQTLVVLRGGERPDVVPVAEEEQRHFFAVEELLDHDVSVLQPVGRVVERGLTVLGHQDALAGGQSVGLDDVGGAEVVECRRGFVHRAGVHRASGRDARFGHDPLGERLGALELRGGLARTEDRDAAGAQRVGDTGDERGLGPDDDQVDVVLERVLRDEGAVRRVERHRLDVGGDAGVARRGRDDVTATFRGRGVLRQEGRDDRVLAGTGTEDEDSHAITLPSPTRRPQCTG